MGDEDDLEYMDGQGQLSYWLIYEMLAEYLEEVDMSHAGAQSRQSSPSSEPAYGASRTTGGILRGEKDKFNLSDAQKRSGDIHLKPARILLFIVEYT